MKYTIRNQGEARESEVDLDSGEADGAYHLDLEKTDWGSAVQPEPKEERHEQGTTLFLPLEEVYERRTIKLSGIVECSAPYEKDYVKSTLSRLFQGKKTIRKLGWEIDVFGLAPVELDDTRRTWQAYGYEVVLYATPPFWRMVQTLNAIVYDELLFPDLGVPMGEAQPLYHFTNVSTGGTITGGAFSFNNWGTAFCYGVVSITGGPAGATIYLKSTAGRFRTKVTLDGSGNGGITEADRFYLAAGDNTVQLFDAAGAVLNTDLYPALTLDFGYTQLRYL